ncbi:MAG: DUF1736 domain-containing protein [candidate division Zixibacteria bacterium]|nr:DUF1736 domain-containing protein [candidate division Zixibacteria bacterium]
MRRYAGYGAAACLWGILWLYVHGTLAASFPFVDNPLVGLSPVLRICTALRIQLDYVVLLLYPVTLSSDYSYHQIPLALSVWDAKVGLFLAITTGAAVAGWRFRTSHPVVVFGMLTYVVLFGVTSNLIQPIGTVMGERLAYAPSFGFCTIAGYGLWVLYKKRHVWAYAIAGLAMADCVYLTIARNAIWADESVFYENRYKPRPTAPKHTTTTERCWPKREKTKKPYKRIGGQSKFFRFIRNRCTTWVMPCAG